MPYPCSSHSEASLPELKTPWIESRSHEVGSWKPPARFGSQTVRLQTLSPAYTSIITPNQEASHTIKDLSHLTCPNQRPTSQNPMCLVTAPENKDQQGSAKLYARNQNFNLSYGWKSKHRRTSLEGGTQKDVTKANKKLLGRVLRGMPQEESYWGMTFPKASRSSPERTPYCWERLLDPRLLHPRVAAWAPQNQPEREDAVLELHHQCVTATTIQDYNYKKSYKKRTRQGLEARSYQAK